MADEVGDYASEAVTPLYLMALIFIFGVYLLGSSHYLSPNLTFVASVSCFESYFSLFFLPRVTHVSKTAAHVLFEECKPISARHKKLLYHGVLEEASCTYLDHTVRRFERFSFLCISIAIIFSSIDTVQVLFVHFPEIVSISICVDFVRLHQLHENIVNHDAHLSNLD